MKIIIAGADANAWVAALKLHKEGHDVEVVAGQENGGVSALLPGSPLAPEVAAEFDLGVILKIAGRVGVSPDNKSVHMKLRKISGEVTERDQARWPEFVQVMNNASEIWRGLFQETSSSSSHVATRWREFGRRQAMEVLRVPCQSLSELLDDWFQSDLLKATLASAALRGSRQGPFAPGSAFLLLQRWARGEVFGRARVGADSLHTLVQEAGIKIHTDQVDCYSVSSGKVQSFKTVSGQELQADLFLSTADPVTALVGQIGLTGLDPDTADLVKHWDVRSTTVVAQLSPSDKWDGATVNFCQDLEGLERAYDPTKYGRFSDTPFAEFDSESGWLYAQHLGDDQAEEKIKALCETHQLGETQSLLTPGQIEEQHQAAGGHLFGGERSLWQSYGLREQLRRPFSNLVLCGAGTGPGDYSGVSGLMATRLVKEPSLA
jgi:phytoene dehydrogenase-like protein